MGGTKHVDAPLPPGPDSRFPIGYGDGGVPPWRFELREGEDVDVGFFKLFVTTAPVDLSSIVQDSPLAPDNLVNRSRGQAQPVEVGDTEMWGTRMATILQRREE